MHIFSSLIRQANDLNRGAGFRAKQSRGLFLDFLNLFECRSGMTRAYAGPVDHQNVNILCVGDGVHDPFPVARINPPVETVVDRGRWAVLL